MAYCQLHCLDEPRKKCWTVNYKDGYIFCVYCNVSYKKSERKEQYEKYASHLKGKKNVCYCCGLRYRTRPKSWNAGKKDKLFVRY
jgi:hypothetical protein